MTDMSIRRFTGVDLVARATASGDTAALAAANAAPILQRDEVIVNGTLGAWDFKSAFCNPGTTPVAAMQFPNLVRGGAAAVVADATSLTQEIVSGAPIGLRFDSVAARINFPASTKPIASQGRFGILMHATIVARDITKYSGFFGFGYALTTQAALMIEAPNSLASINGNVDGAVITPVPYTIAQPFQIAIEYDPAGAASHKRLFYNGVQRADVTFDNGGALNLPTTTGFTDMMAGQLGSHTNTGLTWVLHRAIIEDFVVSGRTMADLVALDWTKRQGRFG